MASGNHARRNPNVGMAHYRQCALLRIAANNFQGLRISPKTRIESRLVEARARLSVANISVFARRPLPHHHQLPDDMDDWKIAEAVFRGLFL